MSAVVEKPEWDHIETVLLDLDGTLLDLAFDMQFWLEQVPQAYAASQSLGADEARSQLTPLFRACEGTLNWYCIDYWTRQLGLDIRALKRAQAHGIGWLPGAERFLQRLRAGGKRLVLMTNAHPEVLALKDDLTGVTRYMDATVSSHAVGFPKESAEFWKNVRQLVDFDAASSLFVDDSPPVLRSAQQAGIRWVCGVRQSSTAPRDAWLAQRDYGEVLTVNSVSDLGCAIPAMGAARGGPVGVGRHPDPSAADGRDGHVLAGDRPPRP
jgi:5'-nucleotidase